MSTADARLIRFLQQENARLKDEKHLLTDEVQALRRYVRALRKLQQTVQRFTPEQDILALLDRTMQSALELLDATDGSLMLIDEETDELVFVLVHGVGRETMTGHRFGRRKGIAGWVAEHVEPAIVGNVRSDARPLAARGRVLGVIELLNKRSGEGFTEDDASLLAILATLSASALDYAASALAETEGKA